MSGPSTLRICLAAMAPALTEAASARMRLQDTSDSENSNSKHNRSHNTNEKPCRLSEISRTSAVTANDFKVLGGHKRLRGEAQVTHLSLADREREGPDFDPKLPFVSARPGKNLHSLLPSLKPQFSEPKVSNPNVADALLVSKTRIESPHYVSEDFQESGLAADPSSLLLRNLKIMNQPISGADSKKEIERGSDFVGLVKPGQNVGGNIFVNGNRRQGQEDIGINCNAKGDAPFTKDPLLNSNQGQINGPNKLELEDKESSQKMGVACTAADVAKMSPAPVFALAGPSCSTHSLVSEHQDAKSCDEVRKECSRKQAQLERKVETLLRRLKRMRGKVVETHAREQLRQFVNFQHRSLQHVAKVMRSEAPGPAELKEHFLSNDEVKSMSTTDLVKLVKSYQPVSPASSNQKVLSNQDLRKGLNKCGSLSPLAVMEPALQSQCIDVSERLAHKVVTVSGELDSDATASSSGGESGDEDQAKPAAERNSSAKPKNSGIPPLVRRAEWCWAADRAGIVSRWTWLQAQVSDLEYRIRQQSQVHRQLRSSKGGVVLGDPPSTTDSFQHLQGSESTSASAPATSLSVPVAPDTSSETHTSDGGSEASPCNIQAVMSNVDRQACRLKQSLGNCLSPASSSASASSIIESPCVISPGRSPALVDDDQKNPAECSPNAIPPPPSDLNLASRTSDLLLSATDQPQRNKPSKVMSFSSSMSSPLQPLSSPPLPADTSCQAARCRPLRSYRKRRILRTQGLHRCSIKAARLSDVQCRCDLERPACPMCGGRRNNTVPMDADHMSLGERVGLLDSSFHPVLSFPWDVGLSFHTEGMLKSGLWQNKPVARRGGRGARYGHYNNRHLYSGYSGGAVIGNSVSTNTSSNDTNHHYNNSNNSKSKVLTMLTKEDSEMEKPGKRKKKTTNRKTTGATASGVASTASVIKSFTKKIKNKYESKTKTKAKTADLKSKSISPLTKSAKKKASKIQRAPLKKRKQKVQPLTDDEEDEEDLEALYLEQRGYDIDDPDDPVSGLSASGSHLSMKDAGHQQRRRKVDNSYDINNIVIPLSMAATVRVEQPQYKEIVTPKWREKPVSQPRPLLDKLSDLAAMLEQTNGVVHPGEDHSKPAACTADAPQHREVGIVQQEEEDKTVEEDKDIESEDLSDEKFALRHLHYELEEKKRFRNFVQYPPLRRNRARSDVSLSSLEARSASVDKVDGVEERAASRPTTPVLMKSLPSGIGLSGARSVEESLPANQRSRTASVSGTPLRRDLMPATENERVCAPDPWPSRSFPLSEAELAAMLEADNGRPRRRLSVDLPSKLDKYGSSGETATGHTVEETGGSTCGLGVMADSVVALSPQSASASASSTGGEELGDPDWVVSYSGGAVSPNTSTSGSNSSSGARKVRPRQLLEDGEEEWRPNSDCGAITPRKARSKRTSTSTHRPYTPS